MYLKIIKTTVKLNIFYSIKLKEFTAQRFFFLILLVKSKPMFCTKFNVKNEILVIY